MDSNSIKINGYQIKEVLGHGGMATVYLAIQESFDRKVAIKIMAQQLSSDANFRDRFLQEARIVSRLIHPNIVTVFDVGVIDNHHYLSMEYIEGVDLKEKLRTISLFHLIKVIKEVALALDYAGRKGYVHRDIKPENIMINNEDGRAVLMDFGIAKAFDRVSEMTQTGSAIGTPYYMSPEQAKGKEVDWRSDIYSLGVVFFQVLTGKLPYQGDSAVSVGIMHLTDPIPVLPDYLQGIFQPIIEKLMAKAPEDRFQNGEDIIQALSKIPDEDLIAINAEFTKDGHRDSGEHVNYTVSTPFITPSDTSVNHFIDTDDVSDDVTQIVRIPQPVQDKFYTNKWFISIAAIVVLALVSDLIFSAKNESVIGSIFSGNKENDKKIDELIESTKMIEQQLIDAKKKEAEDLLARKAKDAQIAKEAKVAEKEQSAKSNKKLQDLLNKASAQEKLIAKNSDIIDELYQTYQLIALLESNHPKVIEGHKTIKKTYFDVIEEHLVKEEIALATKNLQKMLRTFPELESTKQVNSVKNKIDKTHKINQLLLQAEKHYRNNKLSGTKSDNAHVLYKSVLKLSPSNNKAKQGIINVSDKYYKNINQLIAKKQYQKALSNIDIAERIYPNHANKYNVLRSKVDQYLKNELARKNKNNKINQILADANTQFKLGNLVSPNEKNALRLFKHVLESDPDNKEAKTGIKEIEKSLLADVYNDIASQNFDKAQSDINNTLHYFPESEGALAQQFELDLALKRYTESIKPRITKTIVRGLQFSDMTHRPVNKLKAERTIYIGFEFNNFGDKTNVIQAILYAGSVSDKISTTAVILMKNNGEKFFKISRPVEGFAEGGYFIDFILNNEKVSSYKFSIEN